LDGNHDINILVWKLRIHHQEWYWTKETLRE
jgi:hypothetical protein